MMLMWQIRQMHFAEFMYVTKSMCISGITWYITVFVTRATWWVLLVEWELLLLPKHNPQFLVGFGYTGIINNVLDIAYWHFNQSDHSILSMRVRIIEKIYHRTNNQNPATPLHRQLKGKLLYMRIRDYNTLLL